MDDGDRNDIFSMISNLFRFPTTDSSMGGDFGSKFEEMERHMQDMLQQMGNISPPQIGIFTPPSEDFHQSTFRPGLPTNPRDEMLKEPDQSTLEPPRDDTTRDTDSLVDASNRVMFPGFSRPHDRGQEPEPVSGVFSSRSSKGWSRSSTYSWSSSTGDGMKTARESRTYSTPEGTERVETFKEGERTRTVVTKTDMQGNLTKTETVSPNNKPVLPGNECFGCNKPAITQAPENNTNNDGFFTRFFGFSQIRKKE